MTWILETASIEALIGEVVPDATRVTIRFEPDGSAGGSAGCNSFGGSYSAGDDGSLTIEAGGMTQMACEEPLMQVEAAYVAALGEVASFTVTDDGAGLLLEGTETPLAYLAEQPLPLEGTRWRVDGIAIGGDAVSSTIAGADADLIFKDARVSGTGGCNRLTGGYTTDGDALSFAEIAPTMKLCDPAVMDQEAAIIAALEATASSTIEGSTLSLSDADGGFLLSLTGT
ncbi:MAG TPA: META domain-containing protein [Actinomycetota bacterium]|nr:META domain-containing protein [Actinomycetota bacterium]